MSAGVAWVRRNVAIAEESGGVGVGIGGDDVVGTLYGGPLSLTPRNPTTTSPASLQHRTTTRGGFAFCEGHGIDGAIEGTPRACAETWRGRWCGGADNADVGLTDWLTDRFAGRGILTCEQGRARRDRRNVSGICGLRGVCGRAD